jgi:hypothetical protein
MSSEQIPDTMNINNQETNTVKKELSSMDNGNGNGNDNQGGDKPPSVDELLQNITTFLETIKNNKDGGNSEVIETEREKVSKLFNVLSLEDLLNHLEENSNQPKINPFE